MTDFRNLENIFLKRSTNIFGELFLCRVSSKENFNFQMRFCGFYLF